MCLQVRSASSGPRQRDSSRTLENSSLGERGTKGENNTAYARRSPPRDGTEGRGLRPEAAGLLRERGVHASGEQWRRGPRLPHARLGLRLCSFRQEAGTVRPCVRAWSGDTHRRGDAIQNTGVLLRLFFFLNQTNLSARLQKFVKSKP